jgi:hypothetical protein
MPMSSPELARRVPFFDRQDRIPRPSKDFRRIGV